nr:MAG TPA: hypothetical protein [Inoviridae sp.]
MLSLKKLFVQITDSVFYIYISKAAKALYLAALW